MVILPINLGDTDSRHKINADFARGNARDLKLAEHSESIANAFIGINSLALDKAPLQFVRQTYDPLLISQNDLLRPESRPGDAPRLFTANIGGPIDALAPPQANAVLTTALGKPWFGLWVNTDSHAGNLDLEYRCEVSQATQRARGEVLGRFDAGKRTGYLAHFRIEKVRKIIFFRSLNL